MVIWHPITGKEPWLYWSKYSSLTTYCCEFVMKKRKEGRKRKEKEGKALFNDVFNILFMVIWHPITGKEPWLYWSKYSSLTTCCEFVIKKEGRKEGKGRKCFI